MTSLPQFYFGQQKKQLRESRSSLIFRPVAEAVTTELTSSRTYVYWTPQTVNTITVLISSPDLPKQGGVSSWRPFLSVSTHSSFTSTRRFAGLLHLATGSDFSVFSSLVLALTSTGRLTFTSAALRLVRAALRSTMSSLPTTDFPPPAPPAFGDVRALMSLEFE